jgi:hypothetical protein
VPALSVGDGVCRVTGSREEVRAQSGEVLCKTWNLVVCLELVGGERELFVSLESEGFRRVVVLA